MNYIWILLAIQVFVFSSCSDREEVESSPKEFLYFNEKVDSSYFLIDSVYFNWFINGEYDSIIGDSGGNSSDFKTGIKAISYINIGELEKAEKILKPTMEKHPGFMDGSRKYRGIFPNQVGPFECLALWEWDSDKYNQRDEANFSLLRSFLTKYRTKDMDSNPLYNLHYKYLRMIKGGSYSETINLYKEVINEYPNWEHPYFLLKDIYFWKEDNLNALESAKYLLNEKYRVKNSLTDIIFIYSNVEEFQNKDSVEKYTIMLNTLGYSLN